MDSQIDECLLDTAFEQLKLNSTSVERDSSSKPVEIEKLLGDFQQAVNAPDDQEEKLTEALNRLLTGINQTDSSGLLDASTDNEKIDSMIEELMSELVCKDLLYEPFRDLAAKYPKWLQNNKDTLPRDQYDVYTRQSDIVSQIVGIFDKQDTESCPDEHQKRVFDLMQQELGAPPAELL